MVDNPPAGFTRLTPSLVIDGAAAAIDWYVAAFDAVEISRLPMGDRIGHAELRFGDAHLMLSDEWPDMGVVGPKTRGGATSSLMLYVDDVDAAFAKAIAAGATEERAPEDQFWGDRAGWLHDPFGHRWTIATHKEDVAPDEMQRRMNAFAGETQGSGSG